MSFHVRLNKKIRSNILSLPRSHQEKIDKLSDNSYPSKTGLIALSSTDFDIKKCKGHKTRFRVRLGEYRLIYEIDEPDQLVLVLVLKLDTRGDVY
jgi:mRNA-degrading endonuclease RelE of RelBE toxin-antitoxin system